MKHICNKEPLFGSLLYVCFLAWVLVVVVAVFLRWMGNIACFRSSDLSTTSLCQFLIFFYAFSFRCAVKSLNAFSSSLLLLKSKYEQLIRATISLTHIHNHIYLHI